MVRLSGLSCQFTNTNVRHYSWRIFQRPFMPPICLILLNIITHFAEFVENDVINGMLKEIGVHYVQGYGLGKPVNIFNVG